MTKTSIFFVILLSIVTGKTPAQVTPEALLYRNVEQQDSIETHELEEKLRPLREQEQMMYNEICSDAEIARSKAAKKQIYVLKIKY
ncbi:MAG: hypothetical protein VB054_08105, partial [Petrimonas sp.]|nr:hypothetical protein [Petrimonas sp.]